MKRFSFFMLLGASLLSKDYLNSWMARVKAAFCDVAVLLMLLFP